MTLMSFRFSSAKCLNMLGRWVLYIVLIFSHSAMAMTFLDLENTMLNTSVDIQGQQLRQYISEKEYYQQAIDSFLPSFQANLFTQKSRRKADNLLTNFSIDTEWQNGIQLGGRYTFLNDSQGYHQFRASQHAYYQQKNQTNNIKMQRLLALAQGFIEYSKNTSQAKILEKLIQIDTRTVQKSQQRFNNGLTGQSEVFRAKFRHLDLINELEVKQTEIKNNLYELQKLVGLTQKIKDLDPINLGAQINLSDYPELKIENLNDYVQKALGQNDNLKAISSSRENAHYQKQANKLRLAPRISLDLNYTYFQEHNVDFWADDRQTSFSSLIRLDFPLFESTRNYTNISIAGLNEQFRLTQLKQSQINIRENIKILLNRLEFTRNKIKRDQEQLILSKKILKTSDKKYRGGNLALRDFIEDQRFYQRQQIQTLESSFQFLRLYVEFESLTNSANNFSMSKLLLGQNKNFQKGNKG